MMWSVLSILNLWDREKQVILVTDDGMDMKDWSEEAEQKQLTIFSENTRETVKHDRSSLTMMRQRPLVLSRLKRD